MEEYQELEKQTKIIWNEERLSDKEKKTKIAEFVTKLGFEPGTSYWSRTEAGGDPRGYTYGWDTYIGNLDYYNNELSDILCW
jgi:hypothetical protein